MADQQRSDPITDFFSLAAGPIAAVIRSFDQLRKGSDELMRGCRTSTTRWRRSTTPPSGQRAAQRVRGADSHAAAADHPHTEDRRTRSPPVWLARWRMSPLGSNACAHASTPRAGGLADRSGSVSRAINDLVKRMAPLSQLADSAGGLFGLRLPGSAVRRRPRPPRRLRPHDVGAGRCDDCRRP